MEFRNYLTRIQHFKGHDFKLNKEFDNFDKDQKRKLLEAIASNESIVYLDFNQVDLNSEENLEALISFLKEDNTIVSIDISKNSDAVAFLEQVLELLRTRENTLLTSILPSNKTKQEKAYKKVKKHLEFNAIYQKIVGSTQWSWHKNSGILKRETELDIAAVYLPLCKIDDRVNVFDDMQLLINAIPKETILQKLIFPGKPVLKDKQIRNLISLLKIEHPPELSFKKAAKVLKKRNPSGKTLSTLPRSVMLSLKRTKKKPPKKSGHGNVKKSSLPMAGGFSKLFRTGKKANKRKY